MKFLREFKVGDIIQCVYAIDWLKDISLNKNNYYKILKNYEGHIDILPLNKDTIKYNKPITFTATTNYYTFELAGQDYIVKKLKGLVG